MQKVFLLKHVACIVYKYRFFYIIYWYTIFPNIGFPTQPLGACT